MTLTLDVTMAEKQTEPFFTVKEGAGAWRRVTLAADQFPYTMGRARDCDLVVDQEEVSRLHAQLDFAHEQVTITDLGSTNGTFVNKRRLEPHQPYRLRAGDIVSLANVCTLDFDDPATTATIPVVHVVLPGLQLDESAAAVILDGARLSPPLSPGQFALLRLLVAHEGSVVTRDEVRDHVWGPGQHVSDQTLDALVSRLRKRLTEADPAHDYIITRRGFGLMFRNKEA